MSDDRYDAQGDERWCRCGGKSQPESQCPVLLWARRIRTESRDTLLADYYRQVLARERERSADYAQAREQERQLAQYE